MRSNWNHRDREKALAALAAQAGRAVRRYSDRLKAALKPNPNEIELLRTLAVSFSVSSEYGFEFLRASPDRFQNLAGFLIPALGGDSRAFAEILTAEVTKSEHGRLMGQSRGWLPFWRSKFFQKLGGTLGLFFAFVRLLRSIFVRETTLRLELPLEHRPTVQPNAPALI